MLSTLEMFDLFKLQLTDGGAWSPQLLLSKVQKFSSLSASGA